VRTILPWGLFCLTLVGAALPWLDSGPAGTVTPMAAPIAEPADALHFAMPLPPPPLETLPQTRARPLFETSRRPPPKGPGVTPEAVTGVVLLGQYVVNGVVLAGNSRVLLLRDIVADKSLRVREGDMLAGWIVASVDGAAVTLARNGERQTTPLTSEPP
jgi:hypothetical protein